MSRSPLRQATAWLTLLCCLTATACSTQPNSAATDAGTTDTGTTETVTDTETETDTVTDTTTTTDAGPALLVIGPKPPPWPEVDPITCDAGDRAWVERAMPLCFGQGTAHGETAALAAWVRDNPPTNPHPTMKGATMRDVVTSSVRLDDLTATRTRGGRTSPGALRSPTPTGWPSVPAATTAPTR
jgi:hypothetical protein